MTSQKNSIWTPRPYLSFTQMDVLEQSEQKYCEIYFEGKKRLINRGMAFGKIADEADENGELTGDATLDLLMSQIPEIGKPQYEIGDKTGKEPVTLGGVPLYGKLDRGRKLPSRFIGQERKTGIGRWTQKMVDESAQVTFYFTLIYAAFKIKPENVEFTLWYIPTEYDASGRIQCTGENPIPFKTTRKFSDILAMSARQNRAWTRIQELSIEQLV